MTLKLKGSLTERLRLLANFNKGAANYSEVMHEAADEIDRLEAALNGALTDMSCSEHGPQAGWACPECYALVSRSKTCYALVSRSKTFRSFPFRRWSA